MNIILLILGIILACICAILGALGGAENSSKLFRRLGIPLILMGYALLNTFNLWTLSISVMIASFYIGYGIPGNNDEGSPLGAMWYKILHQNHFWADIMTRGTIGLSIACTLLSVPIIKGNWIIYGLGSLGIILINALISWRGIGLYKLFGKELNGIETLVWGLISLIVVLIISF